MEDTTTAEYRALHNLPDVHKAILEGLAGDLDALDRELDALTRSLKAAKSLTQRRVLARAITARAAAIQEMVDQVDGVCTSIERGDFGTVVRAEALRMLLNGHIGGTTYQSYLKDLFETARRA